MGKQQLLMANKLQFKLTITTFHPHACDFSLCVICDVYCLWVKIEKKVKTWAHNQWKSKKCSETILPSAPQL